MIDYVLPMFRNMTLITTVMVLYVVVPKRTNRLADPSILGAVLGLGACISMLDPIPLTDGVFVDSRSTMILLSALFGGPIAAIISASLAAALRIYLGGAGVVPGVGSILISAAIGLLVYYGSKGRGEPVRIKSVLILAALSPLSFVAVFALPIEIALRAIQELFLPTSIFRAIGVLLLGGLLLHEQRRRKVEQLTREQATMDELSGLANRRSFYLALNRALERSQQRSSPVSVVITDLDHFKSINDRYGHNVGDRVIQHFAAALKDNIRGNDFAARIGGEEFALVLQGANRQEAEKICERIRSSIAAAELTIGGNTISYTASFGIADKTATAATADALMSAADAALYDAKVNGRNVVMSALTPRDHAALCLLDRGTAATPA
ncbi:GGDEF domain-containing protein [Amorphus orientalis]|uniref:diguanylate cyclase n=1 Tax=Amorphus orientalis TaxID=649198 RepID=A0AAE4ATN7_9HYPH|nr:diguanylate cyclase [Amorphus orientalis]MDQ0316380.1 diguanylate cyclase [Amorphus orientalis]